MHSSSVASWRTKIRLSRMVPAKSSMDWGTNPTRVAQQVVVDPRGIHAVEEDLPAVGLYRPRRSLISVLLPAPEGPTNATLSPERAAKDTSVSAASRAPGCR